MDDKPHYFGHRQRLRDRFEKAGLDGFAPHEVLELLLTLAVPRRDVKEPVKKLLARFGSLRGVYPRRVVEAALRRGATALILAHNHPNGNVSPSEQDKTLTRTLVLAAETLQSKLVDHLIVSNDAVSSFRKERLL